MFDWHPSDFEAVMLDSSPNEQHRSDSGVLFQFVESQRPRGESGYRVPNEARYSPTTFHCRLDTPEFI